MELIGHEKGKLRYLQYKCAQRAVEYMVLADHIQRTSNYLSILDKLPADKVLPLAKNLTTDLLTEIDRLSVDKVSHEIISRVKDALHKALDNPDEIIDITAHLADLPGEIRSGMVVDIADCECGSRTTNEEK